MWTCLLIIGAIIGFLLDQKYLNWRTRRNLEKARKEYREIAIATLAYSEESYLV